MHYMIYYMEAGLCYMNGYLGGKDALFDILYDGRDVLCHML